MNTAKINPYIKLPRQVDVYLPPSRAVSCRHPRLCSCNDYFIGLLRAGERFYDQVARVVFSGSRYAATGITRSIITDHGMVQGYFSVLIRLTGMSEGTVYFLVSPSPSPASGYTHTAVIYSALRGYVVATLIL